MQRSILVQLFGVALALGAASAGVQAANLDSVVAIDGANYNALGGSFSQFELQPFVIRTDNGLDAVNTNFSFSGLAGNGSPGTMTYSVAANAQSDYGLLRASFNTTVTGVIHNPANPQYDVNTQTGVPDELSGQANAEFHDLLTVTGGPGLTQIRLAIQLDGSLSQQSDSYPYFAGYRALWQETVGGGLISDILHTQPGGASSETILSHPIPVVNGQADVDLLLQVLNEWTISADTQYLADGSTVSASVDFFNTAQITGIEGLDNNLNDVPLTSVVGESGMTYPVPEPASLSLLVLGGLALVRRRRSTLTTTS